MLVAPLSRSFRTIATTTFSLFSALALLPGCAGYGFENGVIVVCNPVTPTFYDDYEFWDEEGPHQELMCLSSYIHGGVNVSTASQACAEIFNDHYAGGQEVFAYDDFDPYYWEPDDIPQTCETGTHPFGVLELENSPAQLNARTCHFTTAVVIEDDSDVTEGSHEITKVSVCREQSWGYIQADVDAAAEEACRTECQAILDLHEADGWTVTSEYDCEDVPLLGITATNKLDCAFENMGGSSFAAIAGLGFDNTYNDLSEYAWGAMAYDSSHCQRGQTCEPFVLMSFAADSTSFAYQSEVMSHQVEATGLTLNTPYAVQAKADPTGGLALEDAQFVLAAESLVVDGVEVGPFQTSQLLSPQLTFDSSGNILLSGSFPLLGGQLQFAVYGYPAYPATPPV